jgi:hypothetical protein
MDRADALVSALETVMAEAPSVTAAIAVKSTGMLAVLALLPASERVAYIRDNAKMHSLYQTAIGDLEKVLAETSAQREKAEPSTEQSVSRILQKLSRHPF